MAERKAVNKYYPPDWDPRKGSVNKRVGQHPLRDRARKLSQGILVIRFELPYNIWCGGCGNHVGMGVRYNAEKSRVGNYYSTPIYKFRMKCHLCNNYFEIQTDPKNHDYVILSGARRKEQRWDPVANEQVVPEDKATQKKMATDPMYKLEHGSDDQQKGKEKVMSLAQIEESRISMQDDYILNRMARDKFRAEKKQMKEAADADQAILERSSLSIDLVEESEEDRRLAGLMKYSVTSSFEEKQKEKRKSIEQRPIFDTGDFLLPSSLSASSSPASLNQEPKPAKLSRLGDLKRKFGQAFKTAFKDPFKIISKKSRSRKSISSSSTPICSRLGIRPNSSKNTTFVLPGMLQKKDNEKTDIVIKSSQHVVAAPKEVCALESVDSSHISSRSVTSDAVSSVVDSFSEEHGYCNSADSTTDAAEKSSEPISTQVKKLVLPESLSLAVENKNNFNQLKDQLKSTSGQELDYTIEDHEQAFTSELNLHKSITSDINISNTSLQALMCSYTDSDSESSS